MVLTRSALLISSFENFDLFSSTDDVRTVASGRAEKIGDSGL
jgi:hypothetical protein